jgi:hypothetical protein
MPPRKIDTVVIHCSASPNGVTLARPGSTAAQVIDDWHRLRGFRRAAWALRMRPHLGHIGYHHVIDTSGHCEDGREHGEVGAHAAGHNARSLGVCLVGTSRFTGAQWSELERLVCRLRGLFPRARLCGHRDLSPDLNADGRITPSEWTKTCPGFDVSAWLAGGCAPPAGRVTPELAPGVSA